MCRSCIVSWTHAQNMAVDPVDTFNNITGWYHVSRNCTVSLLFWNSVIRVSAYARCDVNKDGRFCMNECNSCKQSSLPPTRLHGEKFTHFLKIFLSIHKISCQAQYYLFYAEGITTYTFHGCVAVYILGSW